MANKTEVTENIIEGSFSFNGTEILRYKISYPVFSNLDYAECTERLNNFYHQKAIELKKYCDCALYDLALHSYRVAVRNNFPIPTFEVLQSYTVTYENDFIISLFFEHYKYLGGAHGSTTRHSQTWNLHRCRLIKFEQMATYPPNFRLHLFNFIEEEIKKEPETYFENYSELLRRTFNKNSFYLTNDGIVIYYGQYDIAPYASGIREFLIPYGKYIINPSNFAGSSKENT